MVLAERHVRGARVLRAPVAEPRCVKEPRPRPRRLRLFPSQRTDGRRRVRDPEERVDGAFHVTLDLTVRDVDDGRGSRRVGVGRVAGPRALRGGARAAPRNGPDEQDRQYSHPTRRAAHEDVRSGAGDCSGRPMRRAIGTAGQSMCTLRQPVPYPEALASRWNVASASRKRSIETTWGACPASSSTDFARGRRVARASTIW